MKRHFFNLVSFILFPVFLGADRAESGASDDDLGHGAISGRIVDSETAAPLVGVNVMLANTTYGAASSLTGNFRIQGIAPGRYTLVVSSLGYRVVRLSDVVVQAGRSTIREVALKPLPIELREVIVTANRREQTANLTPASVAVVSAGDISRRNVSTFHQALETVPGISIQRSVEASVQSLSIRGSSDVAGGGVGNRVLLAIDGRPALRSDSGGALWSLVPTSFIDRVEIVKGAFSSLYGSTAMGGVINVITKRPESSPALTVDVTGGFFEVPPTAIRYKDSPNLFSTVTVSHSRRLGKFAYLLDASRKESDGHRQRSAYELYNIYGKLFYNVSDHRAFEVTVGGDIGRNDYPHPWLGNLNPLEVHPRRVDNFQNRRGFSTDVFYNAIANARVKYSSRLFYYRQYFRSEFNPNDPERLISGNEPFGQFTESTSQKLGSITQLDYELNARNFVVAGIDVQRDYVDSVPDTIMFGKHQTTNAAVYAQNEYQFSDRGTLTLGARFDWHKLDGGRTLSQLSPKAAISYAPIERWRWRFLVGRAFRAPSIAERFFREEIAGGTKFEPNPDLEAESVVSLELGNRLRLTDWLNFDVAYFRYDYHDMIYWVNLGVERGLRTSLFQVRNLNKARMQGADVELKFAPIRFWNTSLSYTYLDARDLSHNRSNDTLPYKVKHALSFTTSVAKWGWGLNFDGRYNSAVEEVFLYPNDEPEAFLIVNGKLTRDLGQDIRFSLGVNNLFNVQYEELARYRMPGRSWIFGSSFRL